MRGCREMVTQGWLPPVTLCWCHWAACRPGWPRVPRSILVQFPHCWSERFRSALAGGRPRPTCPLPWLLAVLAAGAALGVLLLIASGGFGLTLHHCCVAVAQPPSQRPSAGVLLLDKKPSHPTLASSLPDVEKGKGQTLLSATLPVSSPTTET